MRVAVTGSAGFVGSHLVESLAADGHDVVGIDMRPTSIVEEAPDWRVEHRLVDLATDELEPVFDDVEQVFHLAGQPGVRASWGDGFAPYVRNNVVVTQRVLESCVQAGVTRYVFASSSSVYGDAQGFPTSEDSLPAPVSPYGVTKLAAEHLGHVYAANFGLSVASVRMFTVYGPRQRADMALHRLISSALEHVPFRLFGSGEQRRDFTYVGDAVAAIRTVGGSDTAQPAVFNVGGGSTASMLEVIDLVRRATGEQLDVEVDDVALGDAVRTGADTTRLRALGWAPTVDLADGVARHVADVRRLMEAR